MMFSLAVVGSDCSSLTGGLIAR